MDCYVYWYDFDWGDLFSTDKQCYGLAELMVRQGIKSRVANQKRIETNFLVLVSVDVHEFVWAIIAPGLPLMDGAWGAQHKTTRHVRLHSAVIWGSIFDVITSLNIMTEMTTWQTV